MCVSLCSCYTCCADGDAEVYHPGHGKGKRFLLWEAAKHRGHLPGEGRGGGPHANQNHGHPLRHRRESHTLISLGSYTVSTFSLVDGQTWGPTSFLKSLRGYNPDAVQSQYRGFFFFGYRPGCTQCSKTQPQCGFMRALTLGHRETVIGVLKPRTIQTPKFPYHIRVPIQGLGRLQFICSQVFFILFVCLFPLLLT